MKIRRNLRVSALCTILMTVAMPSLFTIQASAQIQEGIALQRGYRTGYSDGYMSGYRDIIDGSMKSFERHNDYSKADRAYSKDYGSLDDYRDGYQQGFEAGYETGFERKSFEASLPPNLKKRGVISDSTRLAANGQPTVQPSGTSISSTSVTKSNTDYSDNTTSASSPVRIDPVATSYESNGNSIVVIPRETELILELQGDINTEQSREGEMFTARIISPSELAGATIEGRVSKISKPGRLKRRSELSLTFDRIILDDNRWSNFGATLTEVLAIKGDNVKTVDIEGTARGQSSLKGDAVKVGGSTGAGALIGGVVGGPVGVAVGAGVGAAFGVGAVVIERGKHIRLTRNQQLRIKTAYQTQIR